MYQQQRNSQNDGLNKAINRLASIAAIVVTFFATPLAYQATIEAVRNYTADHYGYSLMQAVPFFWGACTAFVTFFVSTALIITLMRLGQLWLARRQF